MKKVIKLLLVVFVAITTTSSYAQSLQSVYDSYFNLKDALVQSDVNRALDQAKSLMQNISKVDMKNLDKDEHVVWMKLNKELSKQTSSIVKSNDIEDQRSAFSKLSLTMYELIKSSKLSNVIYYQRCPMYNNGKGSTWLSLENTVKNPYYGSRMMNCGKTIETLK